MPFRPVADDRGRLSVTRTEAETFECGIDTVVLRRIDVRDFPVERSEHRLEIGHREDHPVRHVQLTVVPVHHHAQVVEMFLAGEHHRFPDGAFLQLAVAAQRIRVEARRKAPGKGEPLCDAEPLPHRTGRDVDARQDRTGMAVEDAGVRARITEHRTIEIAELGVDRRERRHRVPLAQHEQILPGARRVGDVDVDEPAVVQRDERNRRRERASRVQALVYRVAALLQRQQPDVGVFYRKQLEDSVAQKIVVRRGRGPERRAPPLRRGAIGGRALSLLVIL